MLALFSFQPELPSYRSCNASPHLVGLGQRVLQQAKQHRRGGGLVEEGRGCLRRSDVAMKQTTKGGPRTRIGWVGLWHQPLEQVLAGGEIGSKSSRVAQQLKTGSGVAVWRVEAQHFGDFILNQQRF